MLFKRGFIVVLAFLAFFAVSSAHPVWAACPDATDAADAQNEVVTGQKKANQLQNGWAGLSHTNYVQNYCIQTILDVYHALVTATQPLVDPLSVAGSLIGGALGTELGNLITQTCTSVMGQVMGDANSLLSLAKICLPTPSFGLGIPNFSLNLSGCSGAAQLSFVQGAGGSVSPNAVYSNTWYPPQ